jgi:uracil-DNA glycosylase family 4
MSLDLDKRQRAMLSEMGIKLWQPASKGAELAQAAPEAEAKPRIQIEQTEREAPAAPRARMVAAPAQTTPQGAGDTNAEPAWQLGQPEPVYPAPSAPATSIRWLVLSELGAGATEPLEGEAGQLLDNMLRAAGMHRDAGLQFVPVIRGRGAEAADTKALEEQLAALIQSQQPTAILVMGRLAAQALLPSDQPFGKRQGQHLSAHGCPVLLTYDATYLLRQLPEKARAWEDLCQARVMAARAAAP